MIFSSLTVIGQTARIQEIRLKPNTKHFNVKEETIIFPLISLDNKKIENEINSQIKATVFEPEDKNLDIKKILKRDSDDGLINLDYEVTYNRNNLLSINITLEGCGAYCSNTTYFFNFDLISSKSLKLNDFILTSRLDDFREKVMSDKNRFLKSYLDEEKKICLSEEGLGIETFDNIAEMVQNDCMNALNLTEWKISLTSIEFNEPCSFAHAIRSQEPDYKLEYHFKDIASFLSENYKKILLK